MIADKYLIACKYFICNILFRPGYFDLQVTVFEEVKVAGGGGEKNKKNKK